ncbi:MAG: hypothetical protein LW817_01825 [Candidatus Caenarcaniphilales bacterium]|jgi:hypothetical protein|nr:hypothetical protein [Candidatus Caenarcaniphilales bacterium]
MKKALLIALVAILTGAPVLADGYHKSKPAKKAKEKSDSGKVCATCGLVKALVWTVKLPVRVVTSTGVGLYELVTDGDFTGFKEGYQLI